MICVHNEYHHTQTGAATSWLVANPAHRRLSSIAAIANDCCHHRRMLAIAAPSTITAPIDDYYPLDDYCPINDCQRLLPPSTIAIDCCRRQRLLPPPIITTYTNHYHSIPQC